MLQGARFNLTSLYKNYTRCSVERMDPTLSAGVHTHTSVLRPVDVEIQTPKITLYMQQIPVMLFPDKLGEKVLFSWLQNIQECLLASSRALILSTAQTPEGMRSQSLTHTDTVITSVRHQEKLGFQMQKHRPPSIFLTNKVGLVKGNRG